VVLVKDGDQLDRSCEKGRSITESQGERNIILTTKRSKTHCIGDILRRNCLLKHIIKVQIQGWIEVTGRLGRRHKQLLDDLEETRKYWKLEEEALHLTLWRTRFGRGYGPVVIQATV
jgi:hypothetical protein